MEQHVISSNLEHYSEETNAFSCWSQKRSLNKDLANRWTELVFASSSRVDKFPIPFVVEVVIGVDIPSI